MNPLDLIRRYYATQSLVFRALVRHSCLVADAAAEIAGRVSDLRPDTGFIRQAALLHDIGILYTRAPEIGCFGDRDYVCHGYLGRLLLEEHGMPGHALVCERHVGCGLTAADIKAQGLDLPVRDMIPETVEEQIICFADCFFSKTPAPGGTVRSAEEAAAALGRHGKDKEERFRRWLSIFGTVN